MKKVIKDKQEGMLGKCYEISLKPSEVATTVYSISLFDNTRVLYSCINHVPGLTRRFSEDMHIPHTLYSYGSIPFSSEVYHTVCKTAGPVDNSWSTVILWFQ